MISLKSKLSKLRKLIMDLRISYKLMAFFLVISIMSVIINGIFYDRINRKYITKKVEQSSYELLEQASANFKVIIDNVNNISKLIISNSDIQNSLLKDKNKVDDKLDRSISKYLAGFTDFMTDISSIYIFDNEGNIYYSESKYTKPSTFGKVKGVEWYREITQGNSGYILKNNGGGLFSKDNGKYISLIRIINNVDTQKSVGYMMINISGDTFSDRLISSGSNEGTKFVLLDENGENVLENYDYGVSLMGITSKINLKASREFLIDTYNKKNYITAHMILGDYGWNLLTVSPYEQLTSQEKYMKNFTALLILVNSLFIIFGVTLLSKFITKPIEKLSNSMKGVEYGNFEPVTINTGRDEIGELKRVYNLMVLQIKDLLIKVREDEKVKRKAELDVLMTQIKPHFLYNTFDAISSLALSGEDKKVYEVIKALGAFYRTSLNNGKDIITVAEEIVTVKSYLIIQKIRYGDMFDVTYDLDPKCDNVKVFKLILQPLVENSIYHGIKPKGKGGMITIMTRHLGSKIMLSITDNGVGMDDERLNQVYNGQNCGIGMGSTRERLRLLYGYESEFKIISEAGRGTSVIIKIPAKEVIYHGEAHQDIHHR